MKRFAILFLLLFATAPLYAGNLSASVDSSNIHRHETLTLTLQYDEQTDETPDTSDLEKAFNIRRQSTSAGMKIINGDVSASTTWQYELSPKKTGQLLIPSFSIKNDYSEAIAVNVDDKTDNATQTDQPVYTETSLDKTKVYIQQQVVVSWRLVSRLGTPEVRFTPPNIDGAITQDLGNRAYTRTGTDGRSEWVIEQRYALFPQQNGQITIPPQTFQAIVNEPRRHISGMVFSVPSEISLDTDEQHVDVIPAENPDNKTWLPASSLEISQQITGLDQTSHATAGTAFTRIIRIQAKGLSAEQLPAPDMQADNTRIYSEKPVFDNKASQQGNTGTREDRAAIIATQPGKLVLPAIHVPWYDIDAAQWREAVLPASTIDVLPNPDTATLPPVATTPPATAKTDAPVVAAPLPTSRATTPDAAMTTTHLWQMATGILLVVLLLLSAYIFHLQRSKPMENHNPVDTSGNTITPKRNDGISLLQQAITQNDWHGWHRGLQQWAHTPERQMMLQHTDISTTVQALEKHLYGNGPLPAIDTLKTLTEKLARFSDKANKATTKKGQLDSLYW